MGNFRKLWKRIKIIEFWAILKISGKLGLCLEFTEILIKIYQNFQPNIKNFLDDLEKDSGIFWKNVRKLKKNLTN